MQERGKLEKNLSPINVWAIALGTIIGFGCFVLPGDWLPKGGPMGAVIGLGLGGILMLFIGRAYGYMVKNIPVAGGEYAYTYATLGRVHAFIVGWGLVLAYGSIVPLNATALGIVAKFVAPGLFQKGYLYTCAGWEVYAGEVILASAAMIIFGYLNYVGVKKVGNTQLMMVLLMVGSVLIIGAGAALAPSASISNLKPLFAPNKSVFASIGAILAVAPWAFCGFDTIPQAAEEFDFNPSEAFRLIVLSIIAGLCMYVIVTIATGLVFPWQELIAGKPMWATGKTTYAALGILGTIFLVVAVTMGIFTGINGQLLSSSRMLFSMGRSKILPAWFGKIHPKYGTPSNAVLFIILFSLITPWFGRKVVIWIVDMAAVGNSLGYGYTCVAAYLLAKALPHLEGSSSKSIFAIGALVSLGFLVLLVVPGMPAFMTPPEWIFLAVWISLGAIFYFKQSKVINKIPDQELDYLIMGDIDIKPLKSKSTEKGSM